MSATIHGVSATIHIGAAGYHRYASEFLGAYERFVPQDSGFTPVPYFLVCRSIELAFKSYLVARGNTKKDLMNLSHVLIDGLNKARGEGIGSFIIITDEEISLITSIDAYYHKKQFEYFERLDWIVDPTKLPRLKELGDFARRLIMALNPAVINATSTGKIGKDGLPCS
jgi:hypothetical protein